MPSRLKAADEATRRAILAQCVEDGWPTTEIMKTHGIDQRTIQKYHPGYSGMPRPIRNEITMLRRQVTQVLRNRGFLRKSETL